MRIPMGMPVFYEERLMSQNELDSERNDTNLGKEIGQQCWKRGLGTRLQRRGGGLISL